MMNGGGAAAAANMRARGQHTQVFTDESQNCIVRLHQTNIVTVRQNGDLVLSSGGWRTHQTLKGINTALKTFSPGMQVLPDGHVAEGAWRVSNGSGWSAPFADGITLPGVGPVNLAAQAAQIPGYFEQMSLGFDASNGYGRGGGGGARRRRRQGRRGWRRRRRGGRRRRRRRRRGERAAARLRPRRRQAAPAPAAATRTAAARRRARRWRRSRCPRPRRRRPTSTPTTTSRSRPRARTARRPWRSLPTSRCTRGSREHRRRQVRRGRRRCSATRSRSGSRAAT